MSASTSWISTLSIKELKQLSAALDGADKCLEKADLERLVGQHYSTLDDAQSAISESDTLSRLRKALSQDRSVLNFEHYTPSAEHRQRMKDLADRAPDLFDNPSRTPRSKWFDHPRYRQNSQMPPYHVHFREELQSTLRYLYDALAAAAPQSQRRALRNAHSYLSGCLRGLDGHVRIEEYACFPLYQRSFPHVDVDFLYEDHKELHRAEERVQRTFGALMKKARGDESLIPRNELLSLLRQVLDFDDRLMTHLGEEEELVVPLSLTEKNIRF